MNFWKCPTCGREFSKTEQFHSCVSILIEDHFKNKSPELRKIFEVLRDKMEEFGVIRIDAVQTTINFGGKSQFCVIYALQKFLKLEFVLERKIEDPRFLKIRGPTNRYYTYTIKLKTRKDIDYLLIKWLKESYNLRNK